MDIPQNKMAQCSDDMALLRAEEEDASALEALAGHLQPGSGWEPVRVQAPATSARHLASGGQGHVGCSTTRRHTQSLSRL